MVEPEPSASDIKNGTEEDDQDSEESGAVGTQIADIPLISLGNTNCSSTANPRFDKIDKVLLSIQQEQASLNRKINMIFEAIQSLLSKSTSFQPDSIQDDPSVALPTLPVKDEMGLVELMDKSGIIKAVSRCLRYGCVATIEDHDIITAMKEYFKRAPTRSDKRNIGTT